MCSHDLDHVTTTTKMSNKQARSWLVEPKSKGWKEQDTDPEFGEMLAMQMVRELPTSESLSTCVSLLPRNGRCLAS